MKIVIQVIKVYEIETDGGDTTDNESIEAHCRTVESMQSTQIERNGKLLSVHVENAEVIGPDDDDDDD